MNDFTLKLLAVALVQCCGFLPVSGALSRPTLHHIHEKAYVEKWKVPHTDDSDYTFDYRSYILQQVPLVDNGHNYANVSKLIAGNAGHNVLELSGVYTFLWAWTKNESLAERSAYLLTEYLKFWEMETHNGSSSSFSQAGDFFASFPLVYAYSQLAAADKLHWTKEQVEHFVQMVSSVCSPQSVLDNNAATMRAAGTALALATFPQLETLQPTFQPFTNAVWSSWYSKCDTLENALTYNSIWAFGMLILADLLGHVDDVADHPCVLDVFDRFALQVPPAGSMPAYGDDGSGYPLKSIGYWTPVFERLASLRNHGEYRYLAQRLYSQGLGTPPWGGGVHEVQQLFYVAFTDHWQNVSLKPIVPEVAPAAQQLYREHLFNISEPDKILLTHGTTPQGDNPYILYDLYTGSLAGNEHSHPEQAGALAWYEAEGSVFLHGLGYHSRLPEHAHQVFIADSVENFPMRKKLFTPGVYQRAALPTAHLAPIGSPNNIQRDKIFIRDLVWSTVNFRVQNDLKEDIYLYLDYVTLENDDGTKRLLLDDFSSRQAWGEQVTDTHTGKYAVKIRCPPGISFNTPKDEGDFVHDHYVFDSRVYTQLCFWWKVSPNAINAGNNRLLIFRTPPDANFDIVVPLGPYQPLLANSSVYFSEQSFTDQSMLAYSDVTMTRVFPCHAKIRRQSLLTDDGALIVLDTVTIPNATESSPHVGGPVWHFPVPISPEHASSEAGTYFDIHGFYDSKLNTRGNQTHLMVLVADLPAEAHKVSLSNATLWNDITPYTIAQQSTLEAGRKYWFLTVFHPYQPQSTSSKVLAGCVKVLAFRNGNLDIHLPRDPASSSSCPNHMCLSIHANSDPPTVDPGCISS